jgi:hypothetical protein
VSQRFVLNKDGPERETVRVNAMRLIAALPTTKSWMIEVKQYAKPRTLDQNAATFGLAYEVIMEATGLSGEREREKLHHDFCGDFFGWVDRPIIGRMPRRTTTTGEDGKRDVVDTKTMAALYDHIQRTMLEYGIMVPDPDPNWNNERFKR